MGRKIELLPPIIIDGAASCDARGAPPRAQRHRTDKWRIDMTTRHTHRRALALGLATALALAAPAGLSAHAAPPAHPASVGMHHKKGGHDAGTTPLHAHGKRMRQFQGTVASVAGDAVVLQLQGHQDITATVTISETLTPGALAALTPGERVHIAAVATSPAGDAYVAVRVVIGRRAFGDTDKKTR
jgi:hypothetical protein